MVDGEKTRYAAVRFHAIANAERAQRTMDLHAVPSLASAMAALRCALSWICLFVFISWMADTHGGEHTWSDFDLAEGFDAAHGVYRQHYQRVQHRNTARPVGQAQAHDSVECLRLTLLCPVEGTVESQISTLKLTSGSSTTLSSGSRVLHRPSSARCCCRDGFDGIYWTYASK